MNISKVLVAGCLTGVSFICASAQPLNSSEQDKALELLRQKIAEERAKPAAAAPMDHKAMTSAPAPATKPADPATYQSALDAVRAAIAKSRSTPKMQPSTAPATKAIPLTPAAPRATPAAAAPMSETDSRALTAVREALSVQRQAPKTAAPAAPAKPQSTPAVAAPATPAPVAAPAPQPSGPKSKQQQLAELLQLYKSDRITPLEYHDQRAKIIAQP